MRVHELLLRAAKPRRLTNNPGRVFPSLGLQKGITAIRDDLEGALSYTHDGIYCALHLRAYVKRATFCVAPCIEKADAP